MKKDYNMKELFILRGLPGSGKSTFNNFIEGTKTPHEGIVIKYFTGERNKVAKVIN